MNRILSMATAVAVFAGSADASTFLHSQTVQDGNAKRELSADFSFNDVSETFGMSFDFVDDYLTAGPNGEDGLDGAWWVVNSGGMPFGSDDSTTAILYTDLTNVWAYQYLGNRNRSNPGLVSPLLSYYDNVVSSASNGDGTTKYSLSIDVSALNASTDPSLPSDWVGLEFGENIGTWLHGTYGGFSSCDGSTDAKTNDSSNLNCFDGSDWNGWDVTLAETELAPVPVPGSLGLAAAPLALMGFGAWRRRKAAAKA